MRWHDCRWQAHQSAALYLRDAELDCTFKGAPAHECHTGRRKCGNWSSIGLAHLISYRPRLPRRAENVAAPPFRPSLILEARARVCSGHMTSIVADDWVEARKRGRLNICGYAARLTGPYQSRSILQSFGRRKVAARPDHVKEGSKVSSSRVYWFFCRSEYDR